VAAGHQDGGVQAAGWSLAAPCRGWSAGSRPCRRPCGCGTAGVAGAIFIICAGVRPEQAAVSSLDAQAEQGLVAVHADQVWASIRYDRLASRISARICSAFMVLLQCRGSSMK
jgi:hypothetical protein